MKKKFNQINKEIILNYERNCIPLFLKKYTNMEFFKKIIY